MKVVNEDKRGGEPPSASLLYTKARVAFLIRVAEHAIDGDRVAGVAPVREFQRKLQFGADALWALLASLNLSASERDAVLEHISEVTAAAFQLGNRTTTKGGDVEIAKHTRQVQAGKSRGRALQAGALEWQNLARPIASANDCSPKLMSRNEIVRRIQRELGARVPATPGVIEAWLKTEEDAGVLRSRARSGERPG